MVGSERLTTTRSSLADVVRLWTHALRLRPGCDAPPAGWARVLGYEDREAGTQAFTLRVPAQRMGPTLRDTPFDGPSSPDVTQPEEIVLFPQATQTLRLQAPVLVVVAADFEPESELLPEEERIQALPPLTLEEYEPLHQGMSEPWQPLAPRSRWWSALRQFTPQVRAGTDVSRLVGELAGGRQPHRLPQLVRRGQFHHLLVFRDARKCMHPYVRDFRAAWAQLCAQPQAANQKVKHFHGLPPPVPHGVDAVLLLSDLGLSSVSDIGTTTDAWAAWARGLAARGVSVQAWLPVSAQVVPSTLARVLPCVPWHERSTFRICRGSIRTGVSDAGAASQGSLMTKFWPQLAIAQRIEPALLRRIRLLVGGQGRPEWESMLWRESAQHLAGEQVIQLRPDRVAKWRRAFAKLSPQQQLQVWHLFALQHAHLSRSTLVMERLIWGAYAAPEAVAQVEIELVQAEDWLRRLAVQEAVNSKVRWQAAQVGQEHALHTVFLHGLVLRNWSDPVFTRNYAEHYAPLAVAVGRMGQGVGVTAQDWLQAMPSAWPEIDRLPWSLQLHHRPQGMFIEKWTNRSLPSELASPRVPQQLQLLPLAARHSAMWQAYGQAPQLLLTHQPAGPGELYFRDMHGKHCLRLGHLSRAGWQHALGCDRYGVFCEVLVKDLRLRFRYIPPSTFLQGSPQAIGHANEHPQHPVTLSQGLWLAETLCTQALWQAVMGENPSHFKQGEDAPCRPVETVSWDGVQIFLKALRRLLPPGCEAVLPTESQWEYACRAGTLTQYWWGDAPDDARANWNNQHKGTTPVDRYPPNPWGLYDMHGNVWEWCADGQRDYAAEPAPDPESPGVGGFRVVRGGSWFFHPGGARGAYRFGRRRGITLLHNGFRFALRTPSALGASHRGGADAPAAELPRRDADDAGTPE